jgi:hypothetical protein
MIEFDWKSFLDRWSKDMLSSPLGRTLPDEIIGSGWLGFDPASDLDIAEVEIRLKIALPPSYREFLKVSNGWRRTTHAIERVWGTHEICWFRKKHRDWIDAYVAPASFGPTDEIPDDEYYAYESKVECFHPSHLKETLQISDVGDAAVYLLNPQIITKDGELEAWFFANWLPGAHRYRSFLEMMIAEYHQFAGIEWKQPTGIIGGLPDEYIGSPGSAKRHVRKKRRLEPKVLGRYLREWTVDELVEMLRQTDFPPFRQEIADVLGKLGDPRAVEHLMDMLKEGSNASVHAMYAIKRLAPERLREPLLQMLRERHFSGFHAAANLLAEMGDDRAVPILVEVLKDLRPEAKHEAEFVGGDIALFRQAGFDALVELLKNEQSLVRLRAIHGLYGTRHPDVRSVFEKLLNDPDPVIREQAAVALEILPPRRNN